MESIVTDIPMEAGTDTLHLSLYADIHDNLDAVIPHMRRRAALTNSWFINLGDLGDWILPGDPRYQASAVPRHLLGVDDYVDANIDHIAGRLSEFKWVMLSEGNHCREIIKRHGSNPMHRIAGKLGARYGAYCGMIRVTPLTNGHRNSSLRLLYHHGGSGGAVTRGLPWARRFCSGFEDWDIFAFGHTHNLYCERSSVGRMMARSGKIEMRDRFIVNCGTWQDTYQDGIPATYSEVKGYSPVSLACPLITIKISRNRVLEINTTI